MSSEHWRILHIGNLALLPYLFNSQEEAQEWINAYRVSEDYKEANYKIIPPRKEN